jgi:hypothetical protein
MSNSTSRFVMSKPTKATLNGQVIEIFHQSPIASTKNSIENAENVISRSIKTLKYGMCRWIDRNGEKEHAAIYALPEGFSGVCDEYAEDNFKAIGTLTKHGRGWYVKTNEESVECLRRVKEFDRMNKGFLSIGNFGNDSQAYKEHLESKDKGKGSMFTRGHGIQ